MEFILDIFSNIRLICMSPLYRVTFVMLVTLSTFSVRLDVWEDITQWSIVTSFALNVYFKCDNCSCPRNRSLSLIQAHTQSIVFKHSVYDVIHNESAIEYELTSQVGVYSWYHNQTRRWDARSSASLISRLPANYKMENLWKWDIEESKSEWKVLTVVMTLNSAISCSSRWRNMTIGENEILKMFFERFLEGDLVRIAIFLHRKQHWEWRKSMVYSFEPIFYI